MNITIHIVITILCMFLVTEHVYLKCLEQYIQILHPKEESLAKNKVNLWIVGYLDLIGESAC